MIVKLLSLLSVVGLSRAVLTYTVTVPSENNEAWEITAFDVPVHNAWRTNFDSCSSRDMLMVEVHSEEMSEKVQELLAKVPRYSGIWLGLMFTAGSEFLWISGVEYSYESWGVGYPDTTGGRFYTSVGSDGKWGNKGAQEDMLPACMKKIKVATEETLEERDETALDDEPNQYKPKVYLDGFILHVGEERTDWLSAYYFCKKKGLSLPTVMTEELNGMLTTQSKAINSPIWLALVGAGGRFWWMNGVPFEFSNLVDGYPDAEGRSSIYVVLKEDGMWYDSCMGGSCVKGIPLCVEIAPESTATPENKAEPVAKQTATKLDHATSEPAASVITWDHQRLEVTSSGDVRNQEVEVEVVGGTQARDDMYFTTPGPATTEPVQQEVEPTVYVPFKEPTACERAVERAIQRKGLTSRYVYIPLCSADGAFLPAQCGEQSCWCVQSDGSPLVNSITRARHLSVEECSGLRGDVVSEAVEEEVPTSTGRPSESEEGAVEMLQSLCVVEGKLYKSGQEFTQGCNRCTCWGRDEFTCSPTEDCAEDGADENTFIHFADSENNRPLEGTNPPPTGDWNGGEVGEYRAEISYATQAAVSQSADTVLTTAAPSEDQYHITLYLADKVNTWIEAYYSCKENGMSLPTNLNEELNNYIQNYLRQHSTQTWIDAEQSSGYAYWISGAEMGYTKWAPYNKPTYNTHRRAYVQLSYDGLWYAKDEGAKSNYYCMSMEKVTPKAINMGKTGYCLVNGKQYYQGESFGSTCNRCTCYLYGAVYVDCVKASDCVETATTKPPAKPEAAKKTSVRKFKSKCHGGMRYLDCGEPCKRKCGTASCRRHCTEKCSCPPEKPIFYGGCCVPESVCIDDGYQAIGFFKI